MQSLRQTPQLNQRTEALETNEAPINFVYLTFKTKASYKDGPVQNYLQSSDSEIESVCYKVASEPPVFVGGGYSSVQAALASLPIENMAAVVGDGLTDGGLIARVFSAPPRLLLDLNSMSRVYDFFTQDSSLEGLLRHFGYERNFDLFEASLEPFTLKARMEKRTEAIRWLTKALTPELPQPEFLVMSENNKAFAYPPLLIDRESVVAYLNSYENEKEEMLNKLLPLLTSRPGITTKDLESIILSDQKFSDLLAAEGFPPPKGTSFSKDSHWVHGMMEAGSRVVSRLLKAKIEVTSSRGEASRTKHIIDLDLEQSKFPLAMKYFAAITSRIQSDSRDKINFQGISKRSPVKSQIYAEPGKAILMADYSKIELILSLFLAGDTPQLEAIKRGVDPYVSTIAKIEGVPDDQITDDLRSTGKEVVLSGIFGAAGSTMKASLYKNQRIIISIEEGDKLCKGFRKQNPKIVSSWKECEFALDKLHETQGDCDLSLFGGRIQWDRESKSFLLPSGLRYQLGLIKKSPDGSFSYGPKGSEDKIYPSKLFQNIVQGCGRAMLGVLIENGHSLGMNLALTVHDSGFWSVPACDATAMAEDLMVKASKPPAWAPDIPLKVEIEVGYSLGSMVPLGLWQYTPEEIPSYDFLGKTPQSIPSNNKTKSAGLSC